MNPHCLHRQSQRWLRIPRPRCPLTQYVAHMELMLSSLTLLTQAAPVTPPHTAVLPGLWHDLAGPTHVLPSQEHEVFGTPPPASLPLPHHLPTIPVPTVPPVLDNRFMTPTVGYAALFLRDGTIRPSAFHAWGHSHTQGAGEVSVGGSLVTWPGLHMLRTTQHVSVPFLSLIALAIVVLLVIIVCLKVARII